jgi:hypothetical protein
MTGGKRQRTGFLSLQKSDNQVPMTMVNPRYDDALPVIVSLAIDVLGIEKVESGAVRFLRDAAGVITTIYDEEVIDYFLRDKLAALLINVGSYIDPAWPIGTPTELFDEELGSKAAFKQIAVQTTAKASVMVYSLDRRIIGYDWLSKVHDPIAGAPPIVVFSSLKGGVGRSTALAIAAQDLSSNGLRVLAIDLDLEAPGLGSLLLPFENRPEFGTLDYFVERGLSAFQNNDFINLMEPSPHFVGGAPVYVVPAFGSASDRNPANILGKLARAYIEDQGVEGPPASFLERTRTLIRGLTQARDFDVVLVDARAGMHETAAAPLLGIGADVLLFGVFQSQTFDGYLPLLAHIAALTPNAADLTPRLRMVHSKAALNNPSELEGFRDKSYALFAETLYREPERDADEVESLLSDRYNINDSDGPHYPWQIGNSLNHRLFDPSLNPGQLDPEVYGDAFSDFVLNLRQNVLARLEYGVE